jgi:hypothetical protein
MSMLKEDYPRPTGPTLAQSSLQCADVLLSRGTNNIADCIVAADGGSYSHAALWTGETVVEATLDGIREGAPPAGRDVYRYRGEDGAPLDPVIAAQIAAHARRGVGGVYATHELLLLGTIVALGLSPRRSLVHVALDALGTRGHRLEAWLRDLDSSRKPLICTELVSAAFYDAPSDRAYALRIVPNGARPLPPAVTRSRSLRAGHEEALPPDQAQAIDDVRASCRALLDLSNARDSPTERKVLWGSLALEAGNDRRLGAVTPGDLQFSPSLRFCGMVGRD